MFILLAGQFVQGCSNFKTETLVKHDKSDTHKRALEREAAAKAEPGSTLAEKAYSAITAQERSRLGQLFRTCHAMAKNGRPFTDFVWLCQLGKVKAVDIGSSYCNDKQAAVFTHFIAEVSRDHIRKRFKESNFISIMCDGSTDSGIQEQEIVYVRLVVEGTPETFLVGVMSVQRADAASITEAVFRSFKDYLGLPEETWLKKLVGVGTDGASVMTGCKSGVVTRLREAQKKLIPGSSLVGIHCYAHRLELAFKDALRKIPLFKKIEGLLLGIYYFYRNSTLNRSMLRESFDAENIQGQMPTRVGGTRWVGHVRTALTSMLTSFKALKLHLNQVPVQKF